MSKETYYRGKRDLYRYVPIYTDTGKREHAMALDTLKDLFENDLLPTNKLKYFHQQPLQQLPAGEGEETDKLLVFWYFEDAVKRRFGILSLKQKRPTIGAKETYYRGKRDLL